LGAATVSEAYEISEFVHDLVGESIPNEHAKFIVSGNVRPNSCTWKYAPVQYLRHRYSKPIVDLRGVPAKRKIQALSPKIIISGMAKRPVAFFDSVGEYLSGKSTVILINPKSHIDMDLICVLLNSKVAALIYLALYGGLSLAGGYLRFGPPQLAAFPIPQVLPEISIDTFSSDELEQLICDAYGLSLCEVNSAFSRAFEVIENSNLNSPEGHTELFETDSGDE
jgi:hypothetical protein